MAATFARTLRALESDSLRRRAARASVVVALLALWGGWATFGRVGLHATTATARIEVTESVHAVEAPLGGRVARVNLDLDRPVAAGDVLVELDTSVVTQRRAQAEAQRVALGPRLEAARRELADETDAVALLQRRVGVAVASAQAKAAEAHALAAYGSQASVRAERMQQADVGSAADVDSARAFAAQRRAQAYGAAVDVKRQRLEAQLELTRARARAADLERQTAELEGQLAAATAAVSALDREIEQHVLRAPIAGRLGAVSVLQVGSVIQPGARVAAVVPVGALKAVAQFAPREALGRIAPGQIAEIRLDGFPWTQFGALEGRVTSVGSEPRDDKVQVEIAIDPSTVRGLPLQHGLPGSAEIEVSRVAPFTLLLRGMSQLSPPAVAKPDAKKEKDEKK